MPSPPAYLLRHRGDLACRRVLGDWLEEHGRRLASYLPAPDLDLVDGGGFGDGGDGGDGDGDGGYGDDSYGGCGESYPHRGVAFFLTSGVQ